MVVFVPADEFFSSVLGELRELRQTGALCDVTLTIGEARLPAHRCVLTASSHYFHTLFLGQFKEANVLNIDVSLADVTDDFKALEHVVEFLYTGEIKIDDDNLEAIVKLSTFLLIDRLTSICEQYIDEDWKHGTWLDRYLFAVQYGLTNIESKGQQIVASRFHDYFIHEDHLDLTPDEVLILLRNGIFQHCTVFQIVPFVSKWLKGKATDQHISIASQLLEQVDLKILDCLSEQLKCGIKDVLLEVSHLLQHSNSSEAEEEPVMEKLGQLLPELERGRELHEIKLGQSTSGSSNPLPDYEKVIVTLSLKQCIMNAFQCEDGYFFWFNPESSSNYTEEMFTMCCYKPTTRTWFHIQDFDTELKDNIPTFNDYRTLVPVMYNEELRLIGFEESNNRLYVKVYSYNFRRKSWLRVSTLVHTFRRHDYDQRRCAKKFCVTSGNNCLYLIFKVVEFDLDNMFEENPDEEYFLGCRLNEDGSVGKTFVTESERNHACHDSEIQAKFSSVSNELIFTSGPIVDSEDNKSEDKKSEGREAEGGEEDGKKSVRGYNYVFVVNLSEKIPTVNNLCKTRASNSEPQLTGIKILQTASHFYIVYDGTEESDIWIVYEYKLGSLSLTKPQEDSQDWVTYYHHSWSGDEKYPRCQESTVSDGNTLWSFDGDTDFFSSLHEVQINEDERFTVEEHIPPPFSSVTCMAVGELPVDLCALMTPIRRFQNHCEITDTNDRDWKAAFLQNGTSSFTDFCKYVHQWF